MDPISWVLVGVVALTSGFGWWANNEKNDAVIEAEKAQKEVVQLRTAQEQAQDKFLESIDETKRRYRTQEEKTGNLVFVVDGQAQNIKANYPQDPLAVVHADTTENLSKQIPPEAGFNPAGPTLFEKSFLTEHQLALRVAIEAKEEALLREKLLKQKLLEKEKALNDALNSVTKWTEIARTKEEERTGLARFIEDLIKACIAIGVICLLVYLWMWWRGVGLKRALALKDQGLKFYDKAVAEFGLINDDGNKELAELLAKYNIHVPSILQKERYRQGLREVDRPTDAKIKP